MYVLMSLQTTLFSEWITGIRTFSTMCVFISLEITLVPAWFINISYKGVLHHINFALYAPYSADRVLDHIHHHDLDNPQQEHVDVHSRCSGKDEKHRYTFNLKRGSECECTHAHARTHIHTRVQYKMQPKDVYHFSFLLQWINYVSDIFMWLTLVPHLQHLLSISTQVRNVDIHHLVQSNWKICEWQLVPKRN